MNPSYPPNALTLSYFMEWTGGAVPWVENPVRWDVPPSEVWHLYGVRWFSSPRTDADMVITVDGQRFSGTIGPQAVGDGDLWVPYKLAIPGPAVLGLFIRALAGAPITVGARLSLIRAPQLLTSWA